MKNNKEEIELGRLLKFGDLTKQQRDIFIRLISKEYSYIFQILFNVIEDSSKVIEILDLLEDTKIIIPSRKKMYKLLERINIYTYCKKRNFTKDAIKIASRQYNKRRSQIISYCERIEELLNNYKLEIEDLKKDGGE